MATLKPINNGGFGFGEDEPDSSLEKMNGGVDAAGCETPSLPCQRWSICSPGFVFQRSVGSWCGQGCHRSVRLQVRAQLVWLQVLLLEMQDEALDKQLMLVGRLVHVGSGRLRPLLVALDGSVLMDSYWLDLRLRHGCVCGRSVGSCGPPVCRDLGSSTCYWAMRHHPDLALDLLDRGQRSDPRSAVAAKSVVAFNGGNGDRGRVPLPSVKMMKVGSRQPWQLLWRKMEHRIMVL
ncbi:hypothetical protein ACLOJK_006635 [Asimina triloba]